ncbi:MAG TPA: hypothetical protein VF691_00610 [Cytophagaceae bacterium]|jgi:hypothetical protein
MTGLPNEVVHFLSSKPAKAVELFRHFYECYKEFGDTHIEATKTTITLGKSSRQCYIYQFSKNFVSGVLRLGELYDEPTIFLKPGD